MTAGKATEKRVTVLGAGIAGVETALLLAGAGVGVDLVEKDDFIGGRAAKLACKAAGDCLECNGCLAEARWPEVLAHPGITIHRRAELQRVERDNGRQTLIFRQRPAFIDPERCTACGLCLEACPQPGALRRPLVAGDLPRLAVDREVCLHFEEGGSTMCREVCPEEAFAFEATERELTLPADAVVVATGYRPFPAEMETRWGLGEVPGVVTALELERCLREEGHPPLAAGGGEAKRIAFVQCIGSRRTGGNNYCSRVCCAYALRLGRALTARFGAEVTVFYMDLQSFGRDFEAFREAAARELRLLRTMPYGAVPGPEGGPALEYQPGPGQAAVREEFDLVVLSVGMAPGADNPILAGILETELDEYGFLSSPAAGMVSVGAAGGPMDVAGCLAGAARAARETLHSLEVS